MLAALPETFLNGHEEIQIDLRSFSLPEIYSVAHKPSKATFDRAAAWSEGSLLRPLNATSSAFVAKLPCLPP